MANNTVEQLNFKLIINDKEFDNKLRAIEKRAELFNTSVSKALDLTMNNSRVTKEMEQNYKRLLRMEQDTVKAREAENREVSKTEALQKKLTDGLNESNTALSKHGKLWQQVTSLAAGYFSVAGAEKLLKNLVQVSAEFEFQKTTLRSILQDVQGADTIYEQIKTLAVKSPFNFKELVTYTKQLSAYQIPLNELYETTKMLADVSSGLGVGMDRLVLAYGQVRSAAFLRGQEVRQFTEAGIPILAELAKQFSEIEGRIVSTGEVFDKISKRQVPFEMVAKVFKQMTDEGGKFYKMQEVQAETLKGKISNLTDAYQIMFAEIGEKSEGALKGTVDAIRGIAENYKEIGRTLGYAIVTFGAYRTALALIEAGTIKAAVANSVYTKSFVKLMSVMAAHPYTALALGLTAATVAVVKLTQAQDEYEKARSKYEGDYNAKIAVEIANLDRIFTKLKLATKGTDEYTAARAELEKNYSSYIQKLHDEGKDIDDLGQLYDGLRQKIEGAMQARVKFAATSDIDQVYGDAIRQARAATTSLAEEIGANSAETEVLWQMVTGGLTPEKIKAVQAEYDALMEKIRAKQSANLELMASTGGVANITDVDATIIRLTNQVKSAGEAYATASDALEKFFKGAEKGKDALNDTLNPQTTPEDNNLVKLIEAQIARLQKLKAAYTDISKYLSDEQIAARWGDVFSTGFNFDEQIDTLIAKLRTLGAEGEEAAGKITEAMQMSGLSDTTKQFADAATAAEKFRKEIEKWLAKDFGLEGEGISYDISKIVTQFNSSINAFHLVFEKLRKDLEETKLAKINEFMSGGADANEAEALWENYKANALRVIGEIENRQTEANRKDAQEKINGLAQKYVKETLFKANIDLSELSDKNILQLLKLKDRLQAAMDDNPIVITAEVSRILDANGVGKLANGEYDLSNVEIDSLKDGDSAISESTRDLLAMIKAVQSAKLSFNSLGESISKIFKGKIGDLVDEEKKKLLSLVSSAMKSAGEIGVFMQKIGEVTENSGLAGAGEAIQGIASVGSSMAQGFATGGVWGAAIAGGVELIKQFANGLLEAAEYAKAARTAMDDFVQSVKMAELETLIAGESGIFGTNAIGNLQKDRTALKKALDAILEQEKKFIESEDLLYGDSKSVKWWQKIGSVVLPGVYQSLSGWTKIATGQWDWADILNVMDAGATSQVLDPSGLAEFTYEMLAASNAVDTFAAAFKNMQIKTKDYNGFLEFFGASDEYMSLGDFFPDLFNKDGSINYDLLDEAIEAIEKNGVELTDGQKKMLDTMKANYEKYKEALQSIRDYLSDIFGDLANTIADQMIEAFAQAGNAAIDMGAIFSDVTKKMAKDMITSILYTKVFDDLQKKIEKIYTDIDEPAKRTEAALMALRDGLSDVNALSPEITDLLRGIQDMFGVSFADGADSLANGIKGITEDTANLLASYLNAIRADVSYNKITLGEMSADIKVLLGLVPQNMSLENYLNRIIANQGTIIARLEGALTQSELGGDGFKVVMS